MLDKSGDDAYYLQNGIYRFNGKWKERGLGSLNGKTIEHVDTVEKDGRLYLKLQVTRSTRLRSSILRGRIEDIGKIKPVTRLVDLDADRKRFWLGKLQSMNDKVYNDSTPISLSHFSKEEIGYHLSRVRDTPKSQPLVTRTLCSLMVSPSTF